MRCVLLVGLAFLAASCAGQPTQLVVIVRSDLPAEDIVEVRTFVVPGEPFTAAPSTRSFPVGGGDGRVVIPFSFGVLPRGGDASSRVEITVSAYSASDGTTPTVSRVVRTGFSAGRALAVPVFLSAACRDRAPCAPGLTCDDGECVSPDVPVEDLLPVDPGRELDDAGPRDAPPRDAGTSIGLPPPVRRDVAAIGVGDMAPNLLAIHESGDIVLGAGVGIGGGGDILGAAGTGRAGGHLLRVDPDTRAVRWSRSFLGDGLAFAQGALDGDRLFLCASYHGSVAVEGGPTISAAGDGTDRDDAVLVAEVDAETGAVVWATDIEAGGRVGCTDIAVSGSVLAVGTALLAGPPTLDGAAIPLTGCTADSAVVRLDVSGPRPTPIASLGLEGAAQFVLSLAPDGAGGLLVASSFFGGSAQLGGDACTGGPVAAAVARFDGSFRRLWAVDAFELTAFDPISAEVALAEGRVVVLGTSSGGISGGHAIRSGGREIAPFSDQPRMIAVGHSLATGALDGTAAVAIGGAWSLQARGAGPDVLVCAPVPDGSFTGTTLDVFGLPVPVPDASLRGALFALGPDLRARWVETVVGDSSGIVTECAAGSDGTVWAGGVVTSVGTAFGTPGLRGAVLARLGP